MTITITITVNVLLDGALVERHFCFGFVTFHGFISLSIGTTALVNLSFSLSLSLVCGGINCVPLWLSLSEKKKLIQSLEENST